MKNYYYEMEEDVCNNEYSMWTFPSIFEVSFSLDDLKTEKKIIVNKQDENIVVSAISLKKIKMVFRF